jgi:hypothetical protein
MALYKIAITSLYDESAAMVLLGITGKIVA